MKTLTKSQLAELSQQAKSSVRQRSHFNFHAELSDPIQRLAICMQPKTYVRPHRHPKSFELLIPLQGDFVVLYFDDHGMVTKRLELGGAGASVVEHPFGQWHAVASMTEGAVIFEVKIGPYMPVPEIDLAAWSPPEDSTSAQFLVEKFRTAQVGDILSE